jgi:transcriptional regulator with XRE-family HTH domain
LIQSLGTSKAYRHAFIEEAIRTRITAQIKALRDREGWDYKQFASELKKKLAWAYRLEDPNAAPPTIPSLLEVAETFDVGVDVRFVPFSVLADDATSLKPESFQVASFKDDVGLIERKEPILADMSTANVGVLSVAAGGVGGRSLQEIGKTPAPQSLLQHSSSGSPQVETMQQPHVTPSGIPNNSLADSTLGTSARVVSIDHRRMTKEDRKRPPRKPSFSRRSGVYA